MILSIKNLHKQFISSSETLTVFKGFSMELDHGQSLAITGESGCGKSTLLNIIAKLDNYQKGTILFNKQDINSLTQKQTANYRNQELGFIFQFHFLLKDFNAEENVALNAMIKGDTHKIALQKSRELLDEVGLNNKGKSSIDKLSGGERQRVAIARALINQPKLILADEPTGSLDEQNSNIVQDLLFRLSIQRKCAIILVTHDKILANKANHQLPLQKYRHEN